MKTIIIILSIFLTQNCNDGLSQINPQEKLPSVVEEVYFQRWTGGQEQTGSGVNFSIKFKTAFPKGYELKKVHFQKKTADFENRENMTFLAFFYQRPKTDLNLDGDSKKEYGNQAPEITQTKFKLQDNEAVLEFIKNKKSVYFTIKNIKEKELIAYPTARPQNND
jgi:hypothetical protein